jgi:glycosyltransferase involved in cell wall biosynthesis
VIVVDDGSTDATQGVLASYGQTSKVRYILQEHQRQGAARNTGILSARGEYIAFLDADDTLTADSLATRMALATQHPRVGFVFADYFYQSHPEERVRPLKKGRFLEKVAPITRAVPEGVLLYPKTPKDIFEISFHVTMGTVLVRKALFQEVGLFRTDIFASEDEDMWIRLVRKCEVGYVDFPSFHYKRHRSVVTMRDPLEYARARLTFLRPLLTDAFRDQGSTRIVRQRLAWVHYDLARHYSSRRSPGRCAANLAKSFYYDPANLLPYKLLLFSLIPKPVRRLLRPSRNPRPA